MPVVEESIDVKMSVKELFPILSDYERYPEFMESCDKVVILERGDDYTISEWRNTVAGRIMKWTERDEFKPEENRIDFNMIRGDLKEYGGFWQLEPHEDSTTVTLNVGFEVGVPMLAPMLNPLFTKILRDNMLQMLTDIKVRAEQ